ncbi:hypothetical protein EN45_047290 [Penicillium chrysogenum]|uniref:Uncharacterized protein n=1 Tax=Penicillium chrysogenum TaxID=5076 RepID=A0A167YU47_PENCH|nr:hypothetical protein N7505_002727 [Penicillium chrysogenum]KZN94531.1 hypothetical protein EN45_047290 [Penicillium chrysogenum]
MTKLKEVDSKSESESDRRQQTQKAKILAKIAEKVFNDVVESVQKGNSESLWEVGLQAFEQANELSLIQKAGPIETLPIGEAARFDIVNGFGLQEQGEESLELQPWPPCPLPTVELPDSAQKMIEITNKYLRLSTQNEAATRCIINDILFALLDTVGKVYQAKGTCDYTLWYGDKGGADKAINLVLVEAKKLGLASQGDDQALGYMACVHQERRTQPSQNSTVYGLSTDGEEFRFLRINERSEFTKVIMTKTPGGNYSRITSMIAFIMREAVSQSSYTSRNTSKDVSMEDDPVTLPPDV